MEATSFFLLTLLSFISLSVAVVPKAILEDRHVEVEHYHRPSVQATDLPIIGILSLPVTVASQRKYGNSSFATSYTRWLEAGGARTVPILFDSSPEELDYLLARLNGVFWTGGLVDFNPEVDDPQGSLYLKTTAHIWRYVLKANEKGQYYPFWGTCLGFERIIQLFAHDNDSSIFMDVDAENFGINLELTPAGWLSRLFGGMSLELFKAVASPLGQLAFNNHGLGVHPHAFRKSLAGAYFKVLSMDEDRDGKLFVSTMEGRQFPFYGSQWHPEKAPWEWEPKYIMSHSEDAVEFSNYLGRFFVSECKYNPNQFENKTVEAKLLMNNWPARATGKIHGIISAYSEITFFKKRYAVDLAALGAAEAEAKTGDAGQRVSI